VKSLFLNILDIYCRSNVSIGTNKQNGFFNMRHRSNTFSFIENGGLSMIYHTLHLSQKNHYHYGLYYNQTYMYL